MDTLQPATKGDVREAIADAISGLEARQDAKFATKQDLADLGTRLDAKIDASTKRLALEIVNTNDRVRESKEQTAKAVSDNADRILTALDRYSRIVEADNRGVTLHGAVLTEVQLKLQSHDQRITRLEASRGQPG